MKAEDRGGTAGADDHPVGVPQDVGDVVESSCRGLPLTSGRCFAFGLGGARGSAHGPGQVATPAVPMPALYAGRRAGVRQEVRHPPGCHDTRGQRPGLLHPTTPADRSGEG